MYSLFEPHTTARVVVAAEISGTSAHRSDNWTKKSKPAGAGNRPVNHFSPNKDGPKKEKLCQNSFCMRQQVKHTSHYQTQLKTPPWCPGKDSSAALGVKEVMFSGCTWVILTRLHVSVNKAILPSAVIRKQRVTQRDANKPSQKWRGLAAAFASARSPSPPRARL